jgi:lipopolysaccharide/colanic/teichoic acid biosynthesis glycosyltransferase
VGTVLEQEGYQRVDDDGFCVFWVKRSAMHSKTESAGEAMKPSDVSKPAAQASIGLPHSLYQRLFRAGFRWLYVLDAVGFLAVMVVVMVVRFGTDWSAPLAQGTGIVVAIAILQTCFYFGGMYERQQRLGQRMWFSRIAVLTFVGLVISFAVILPTGRYPMPRANLAFVGILVALVATFNRGLARRLRSRRFGPPKVLLVGLAEETRLAAEHLGESDRDALVVAEVSLDADLVEAVNRYGATDLVIVGEVHLDELFPEPAYSLDALGRGIYLRVTSTTTLLGLREVREIGGMPYLALRARALRPQQIRLKRLVELLVVLCLVPFLLVILLAIWSYLRVVAGKGVFLRQERTGKGGRPFQLVKFRTMRLDAERESGPLLASLDDGRILRGCGWLRRSRLDEFPQFWNVVRGEMSLVGPRPERPEMTRVFEQTIPGYSRRYEIPPGITGLAQTKGGYWTDPAYKLSHDLQYLMAWSPLLDLLIMVRTVGVMFRRKR